MAHSLSDRIIGDCIHQSDFEGSDGGDFFRGNEQLERPALPDQAWQALRAAPSGHEAESGAAMSKDCVRSGDPPVTGERKIKPSAHAVAFDRGDDGDGIAGDRVHERLSHGGELAGFRAAQWEGGDFVEVRTHRKESAIACNDQGAGLFRPSFLDGSGECAHAGAG